MTPGVYARRSRGQKGVKEQTSDAKFSTAKGKFECFFFFFLELAHVMLLRNPVAKIKKKRNQKGFATKYRRAHEASYKLTNQWQCKLR